MHLHCVTNTNSSPGWSGAPRISMVSDSLAVRFSLAFAPAGNLIVGSEVTTNPSEAKGGAVGPVFDAWADARKCFADLRIVVNAILYIAHTGCQWRFCLSACPDADV